MKGLTESSPFHLLTNPHVINRFVFGHEVVFYHISLCMAAYIIVLGSMYYCILQHKLLLITYLNLYFQQ